MPLEGGATLVRGSSGIKRLADRFAHLAAQCPSLEELRSLLNDACKELGFEHFALLHHASVTHGNSRFLRIDNYPEPWVRAVLGSDFASDDPVHLACRRTNAGFAWSEIDKLIQLNSRHREILARGRHFGLEEGFTIPVNVPGEPSGSCSFVLAPGSELSRICLFSAEIVGVQAFKAARRLQAAKSLRLRPHLSRREIECVRLVALGKSDWEIGIILGISTETARQYVKRARLAYDVISRTQLAVRALYDGWIDLSEVGPEADL